MPPERTLPTRRNPHLAEENSPNYEVLIERRRASTTELRAKPGTVGLSNATKPSNLGFFDYVHLKAPLPKNLKGSEIFLVGSNAPPSDYFLMRRSADGFVSVSGMFKASFPWATRDEMAEEHGHFHGSGQADPEEVAGNVWAREQFALDLAAEYGIYRWIVALLDPHPIHDVDKAITLPPTFTIPKPSQSSPKGAMSTRKRTTSRDLRSMSPVKQAPPSAGRPKATPKKRRARKAADATPSVADSNADDAEYIDDVRNDAIEEEILEAANEIIDATAEEAAATQAIALAEAAATVADEPLEDGTVRVTLTEDVIQGLDDTETTRTTVKVEMPAGSPDLTLPVSTDHVVEIAGQVVADAKKLEAAGASKSRAGKKRKAESLDEEVVEPKGLEEVVEVVAEGNASELVNGEVAMHPSKRTRIMVAAEEYRREKVKRRALMGLSGALAVGVMLPFISNLF